MRLLLLAFLALPALAQPKRPADAAPQPFALPGALELNADTKLTLRNAPLGDPRALWTSFPAKVTAIAASSDGHPRFAVRPDPAVTPGVYAVRLLTSTALGPPILVLIDDLPTTRKTPGNTSPATAEPIEFNAAVDAAFEPLTVDHYAFTGKKGQSIGIEVYAQRLGFRADPVVTLIGPDGREVRAIDDTPGLGADIRANLTLPADGRYVITIRDAEYGGAAELRYRLRLGDFPAVTAAFPAGGNRGRHTAYEFTGPGGTTVARHPTSQPAFGSRAQVAVKDPAGRSASVVPIVSGLVPEALADTNHSRRGELALPIPAGVIGRFMPAATTSHSFTFDLKKDQKLAVRARTRAINSPAVLRLELLGPDRAKVAESKPANADDGLLDATATADGQHTLIVSELTGATGPAHVYQLHLDLVQPGFTLDTETDGLTVKPGGSAKLKVKLTRRDYDGPITLSLIDAPLGWTLTTPTIAEGRKDADLEIKAPADAKPGTLFTCSIQARATIAGHDVTEHLSTAPALRAYWPRIVTIPPELDGVIAIGVK
ncbi:MAG: hypothetical protein ACAI43_13330 [Phycisphaerae bacterium]